MLKHLLVTVAAKFVQLRLPEMKSEGVPFSEGRISPWLIKSSSNTFPVFITEMVSGKKRDSYSPFGSLLPSLRFDSKNERNYSRPTFVYDTKF